MECWLPVTGWEGRYEVSDRGGVRNARTGLVLKARGRGVRAERLAVCLSAGRGRRDDLYVHRLVAAAFLPAPHWKGAVVSFRDGDPTNVAAANLFWTTYRTACRLAREDGRAAEKERNGSAKLTSADVAVMRARLARGDGRRAVAADYGVGYHAVQCIDRGRTWRGVFPALGVA